MTTRDEEFGKRIKAYLDQGPSGLRSGIAYRLQEARAAALAQVQPEQAEVQMLESSPGVAGIGGSRGSRPQGQRPLYAQFRVWAGVAVLIAAMLGYQQWTAWQQLEELEDLDAQILTSDLPIDAYLDRGFQLWLKTSEPDE